MKLFRTVLFWMHLACGTVAAAFALGACLSEADVSEPEYDSSSDSLTVALQAEQQSWTASSGDSVSKSDTTLRLQANASGDSSRPSTPANPKTGRKTSTMMIVANTIDVRISSVASRTGG